MITVRFPAPTSMLLVNLLGLFGLLGIAAAVGGLSGNWWWALAAVSVEAVFLSVVAASKLEQPAHVEQADRPAGILPKAA